MAVSFKVPKSPKKNIFAIDNFLGVDLTNTGANIDEVRSPNAENMVRYVPGKVRKRTGYYKEIIFGKDINVNYAVGTSAQEQATRITDETTNQWVKVYDLTKRLVSKDGNAFDLYVEFDYKAEKAFSYIVGLSQNLPASKEWTHESKILHLQSDGHVNWIGVWSTEPQDIYIKNFSVMYGKDASYKWSPAPKYFVERANNDPVYGCHVIKTGNFEGNRVVNVNRALNTSSSFRSYSINNSWVNIATIGEIPYPNIALYIECDYKSTGDDIAIAVGNASAYLPATGGETQHRSVKIITGNTYSANRATVAIGWSGARSANVQIKNLAVLYDVNELYDWSPAPEDNGATFPEEDLYLIGSTNYAISNSFDDASYSSEGEMFRSFYIENSSSNVKGFSRISFDIHTASYMALTDIKLQLANNDNVECWSQTFTEHLNSKHFELYVSALSANNYIARIAITYHVAGGICWTYVSNVQVNEITPRSSYDISSKWYIYHVGSDFFLRASNSKDFTKVYDNANQHLSKSWQFNKNVYILDGKNIYSYATGDETVKPIGEENGYIPTLTIAKEPSGGGVTYEPLNMLQPGFYELFQGKENVVIYQLSFGNLDSTTCKAWVMNSSGGWDEKVEGTDFNVNRGAGYITFTTAPGVSPLTGEDNVKILAYRTVPGYRERITNCTNGALFGVGGAEDRLFLTGNPDYPNWDFYSEQYNPAYFPDTGYSALGSEQSAIVGYAIINNYLAAFKDGFDTSQSVFIREGDLVVNKDTGISEPAFKLINTLQGNGVVAPYAFGYLQTEPLFLTKAGIYAITAQDITGEKYSQNRSFYLNGRLTQEPELENAVATVHNDQYYLAVNDQLYILDGLQATRTDKSEPYATRQYVGFHCKNVPALCIWSDNDAVWFGTRDGKVCAFHNDIVSLDSYNDDGQPIYACWDTPDLDGKLFYKNKTFRYFAIRLMKSLKTSVKLYSQKLGTWTFIKEDTVIGKAFDFEDIDFELFSFSTDTSEKVVHTKVRVKKVDKARFRVENDELNESFGLFDLALEYIESGNYKG